MLILKLLPTIKAKGKVAHSNARMQIHVHEMSCNTPPLESDFCGSKLHMIKCRGAQAADGLWKFSTDILSFCWGKDVTLGTFSVCIYRMTIKAFEFEAF